MDPAERFNSMMEAFSGGRYADAADHANHLADWLNEGGFPPTLRVSTPERADNGFIVGDQLAREFCRASCRLVLDQNEAGSAPAP
mgnify:CR=1 FL=1